MRGLPSTIALIVVLAGLGAYIYFVTWKTPEGGDTGKKTDKVFAGVQADKIEEIRITTSGGDATTVKKDNATWSTAWRSTRPARRTRWQRTGRTGRSRNHSRPEPTTDRWKG